MNRLSLVLIDNVIFNKTWSDFPTGVSEEIVGAREGLETSSRSNRAPLMLGNPLVVLSRDG